MAKMTITIDTENNRTEDVRREVNDAIDLLRINPIDSNTRLAEYIGIWAQAIEGPDGVTFRPPEHPDVTVNIKAD